MKSEIERQTPYDIAYTWNQKYGTNEHIYKTEMDSQTEETCWLLSGVVWEGWSRRLGLSDSSYYI